MNCPIFFCDICSDVFSLGFIFFYNLPKFCAVFNVAKFIFYVFFVFSFASDFDVSIFLFIINVSNLSCVLFLFQARYDRLTWNLASLHALFNQGVTSLLVLCELIRYIICRSLAIVIIVSLRNLLLCSVLFGVSHNMIISRLGFSKFLFISSLYRFRFLLFIPFEYCFMLSIVFYSNHCFNI